MWSALLSCVLAAQAGDPAALAQAEAAYAERRYERILPLLEDALASELAPADRVRAWSLKALTHAAFDESGHAVDAYVEALKIDPSFHPGDRVSPKVRGLFAEARRRVPAPGWAPGDGPPAATGSVEVSPRWYQRPWVWALAGGVVVAAGASTWALTRPQVPTGNVPNGALR